MSKNSYPSKVNQPTKYQFISFILLIALFGVGMLQNLFRIFIINILVIFGTSLLLNRIA